MTTVNGLIIDHEGLVLLPYCDRCGMVLRKIGRYWGCDCADKGIEPGKITIGYGRNLEDVGLWTGEAAGMLSNDISQCVARLAAFKWWNTLDQVRRAVCIDMTYNLGFDGFRGFVDFIRELGYGHWTLAQQALLASKAAGEEPKRFLQLGRMIQTGQWPSEGVALDAVDGNAIAK